VDVLAVVADFVDELGRSAEVGDHVHRGGIGAG
jgi:hypothetical protein